MPDVSETITIDAPPERVWPLLSDPALVASCIPGATLKEAGEDGVHRGEIRVKFGPTVATFRGEATLAYDDAARRCTIEGRGVDQRGASNALASGTVEASGTDTTTLAVHGTFNVTGPLETFANAGGVHVARALLGEFAKNMAQKVGEQAPPPEPPPAPSAAADGDAPAAPGMRAEPPGDAGSHQSRMAAQARSAPAAELSGGKIAWQAFLSWLKSLFGNKRG